MRDGINELKDRSKANPTSILNRTGTKDVFDLWQDLNKILTWKKRKTNRCKKNKESRVLAQKSRLKVPNNRLRKS